MQVSSGSRYWPAHIAAAAITARLPSQVGDKKISRKTGSDAGVDFPSGKNFPANSSGINNIMRRAFSVHRLKAARNSTIQTAVRADRAISLRFSRYQCLNFCVIMIEIGE